MVVQQPGPRADVTGPALTTPTTVELLIFQLDQQRYALPLARVERVLRRVAVAPFPKAPAIVSGVFELQGSLVPVVEIRQRFGLAPRAPRLSDQFLLAHARRHRVALAVEAVEPVVAVPAAEIAAPERVVPGLEYVRGIVRLPGAGVIFVHDLDALLSLEEDVQLATAMQTGRP